MKMRMAAQNLRNTGLNEEDDDCFVGSMNFLNDNSRNTFKIGMSSK